MRGYYFRSSSAGVFVVKGELNMALVSMSLSVEEFRKAMSEGIDEALAKDAVMKNDSLTEEDFLDFFHSRWESAEGEG